MPTTMTLRPPADFRLDRDACSYGYFLLDPNHWTPSELSLRRVLNLPGGAACAVITQGAEGLARKARRGKPLTLRFDRTLTAADRAAATTQVTRMLRLDEDAEHVRAFHKADPRWRREGNARLCRSPSFFEDVIKTVTSCNVAWPSTIVMNRRLCEVLGEQSPSGTFAFPTPAALAAVRPAFLRGRCRVGYRDGRMIELARMFDADDLAGRPAAFFEDPTTPDEDLRAALLELPGIGPYAAHNVMQLLGRYGQIPCDSESVRHGRTVLKMRGSEKSIMRRIERHFEPFGENRFRSYWFELRTYYEQKAGPAWTWEKAGAARFTAAQFEE